MGPPKNPFLPRLSRRRPGKIGHLSESVRREINILLEQKLPYKEIIARLGERGLNKDNLSRWRKAERRPNRKSGRAALSQRAAGWVGRRCPSAPRNAQC